MFALNQLDPPLFSYLLLARLITCGRCITFSLKSSSCSSPQWCPSTTRWRYRALNTQQGSGFTSCWIYDEQERSGLRLTLCWGFMVRKKEREREREDDHVWTAARKWEKSDQKSDLLSVFRFDNASVKDNRSFWGCCFLLPDGLQKGLVRWQFTCAE